MVMVDEAHATGVFGASGAGVVPSSDLAIASWFRWAPWAKRLADSAPMSPAVGLVRFVDQPLPQFYFHNIVAAGGHGYGDGRASIW